MRRRASALSQLVRVMVRGVLFIGCSSATPEDVQILLPPTWSDPCGQETVQELSWERAAKLSELKVPLDELEGQCEGKLEWNAPMADDGPALAHTTVMRVEVAFDRESARLSQRERRDVLASCADKLTVDARVKLTSGDGAFAAEADTVLALSGAGARSLVFAVPAGELKGSFGSTGALGEGSVVIFRLDGAAANCAGDISVVAPESESNESSAVVAPELAVGSWSAGGCARGELPRNVHERVGDRTLLEQAHEAWDNVSLSGRWDDGGTGALRLDLISVADAACLQPARNVFSLPARVRFSTDDGRIGEHEAAATIALPDSAELTYVELHVEETTPCSGSEREAAAWPDCQSDLGLSVSLSLVKDLADAVVGTMGALLVATLPDAPPVKLTVSSSAGSQRQ